MTDIDDRLRDYAHRWRTAQPAPPSPAVGRPRSKARRFEHPRRLAMLAATTVVVAGVATVVATHHGPTRVTTASPTGPPIAKPFVVRIVSKLGYENGELAGTGVVVSPNGEVVTTNSVIDGATSIQVTGLGDGRTYAANVIGYDAGADVAVLQMIGASGLEIATIGDSANLSVGQSVTAIQTATAKTASGKITALNQSITVTDEANGSSERLSGLIETNVALRSGDSGAPLLSAIGKVIGIEVASPSLSPTSLSTSPVHPVVPPGRTTLANPQSSGPASLANPASNSPSYAIPIDHAMAVVDQVQARRSSSAVHVGTTALLGVEVTVQGSRPTVNAVVPGSPAASVGIAAGDLITTIGGRAVQSPGALTAQLSQYHAGDQVPVTWNDQHGRPHTATVTLSNGPAQ